MGLSMSVYMNVKSTVFSVYRFNKQCICDKINSTVYLDEGVAERTIEHENYNRSVEGC